MIKNRYLSKVIVILLAICFVGTMIISSLAPSLINDISYDNILTYPTQIFGQGVIDFQITADESQWQSMLDNASSEEYIRVDLVINGTKVSNVGIRPKGNNSLSTVSGSDSDRYSFKIKFDEYIAGQTFFGLDKMVINNILGDSSYLIEYISYDIMDQLDVPTPEMEYANISVNGENWGLYLALESYEDSFLLNEFSDTSGNLYNVKMSMGGGGGGERSDRSDFSANLPEGFPDNLPEGFPENLPANFPDMDFGGAPPDSLDAQASEDSSFSPISSENRTQKSSSSQNDSNDQTAEKFSYAENNSDDQMSDNLSPPQNNSDDRALENSPTAKDSATTQSTKNAPPSQTDGEQDVYPTSKNSSESSQLGRSSGGRPGGGMGGGGMGGANSGGSLQYTDDDPDSYSSIFENATTNSNEDDYAKVITALKNLSEGKNLEQYFDVDEILRYLAAHTFVVNLDSYSSNMAQNYYIYESDGKISILPWDYNYAFGGFMGGSASTTINFPIDTPVSGVEMEDRPLISQLLEVEEYKEKYHSYLQEIVTTYIDNGRLEELTTEITEEISPHVEADTTKFVTYDEYLAGVEMLKDVFALRAQSVQEQLNGTVPSTTETQSEYQNLLISTDSVNLNVLSASPEGGRGGGRDGHGNTEDTNANTAQGGTEGEERGQRPGFSADYTSSSTTDPANTNNTSNTNPPNLENMARGENSFQPPSGSRNGNNNSNYSIETFLKENSTMLITMAIIVVLGFITLKVVKRKY